ncbi:DUF1127 domain-containing protein [Roseomonas xinghualingensis]|uniref:DUF1127 domain-containing protein n=1 Tax=Roseomonas xinghualingensis TaxID=2986475 RepID=UPI0021F192E4|nr:DUF1127 domain-containing protein [Roseomonas sp. SXEYE001]MCV4207452.1 DUF1127 domain-containing protein [Roseomonas sp. SXEYE001]
MNPRISQMQHPAPMMPYPANMQQLSDAELLRQANEARNAAARNGMKRLFAAFANWMERRRAETELRSLTDRELADIGLTRGDIPFALSGGAALETRIAPAPQAIPAPMPANDRLGDRAAA